MSAPESDAAAIARAVIGLGRRLRSEQAGDAIGVTAAGVLSALDRLGAMSAAKLAAEERLQPQSLSRILAELEGQGRIRRRRNPEDRRAIIVEITPIGRHVLASEGAGRDSWLEQAMARRLTLAERGLLRLAAYLMQKLAANADV